MSPAKRNKVIDTLAIVNGSNSDSVAYITPEPPPIQLQHLPDADLLDRRRIATPSL
ncbi:MAG: hypothetical protein RLZZ568_1713 [Cyanobacteriota bacterium]